MLTKDFGSHLPKTSLRSHFRQTLFKSQILDCRIEKKFIFVYEQTSSIREKFVV